MEAPRRLSLLAQQQYGLVSLQQAVALGLPARTLQDRVRRQGWVRVHRGVYALPGSVRTYERDIAGALLAAGPSAAACAGAAAFLHGLTRAQTRPIELVVPVPRRCPCTLRSPGPPLQDTLDGRCRAARRSAYDRHPQNPL